jgi:hypothetical protein
MILSAGDILRRQAAIWQGSLCQKYGALQTEIGKASMEI